MIRHQYFGLDPKFKQIWPDQGDWNAADASSPQNFTAANLNKFDPIKGIETFNCGENCWLAKSAFKQIWPDQGDWNDGAKHQYLLSINLNKFDPIKGIETSWVISNEEKFSHQFKQIWPDQGDWNVTKLTSNYV